MPPSGMTFYNWDETNRLSVANPVAGPVSMLYNGEGQRVRKQTATQTRNFFFDFENVLQEYDGTGDTTKEYTSTREQYGDLLSAYDGSSTTYYEPDAIGSTDALLDDTQSVTDRYAYRAFGLASQLQGSPPNNATWVGRKGYYSDFEMDLYFLRARYYDFVTGTFLSEDPSGYKGGDSNLYRYVGNNPVNGMDPSGLALLVEDKERLDRAVRVPLVPCSKEARKFYQTPGGANKKELAQGFYTANVFGGQVTDVLRDKIYDSFGPWPGRSWSYPDNINCIPTGAFPTATNTTLRSICSRACPPSPGSRSIRSSSKGPWPEMAEHLNEARQQHRVVSLVSRQHPALAPERCCAVFPWPAGSWVLAIWPGLLPVLWCQWPTWSGLLAVLCCRWPTWPGLLAVLCCRWPTWLSGS